MLVVEPNCQQRTFRILGIVLRQNFHLKQYFLLKKNFVNFVLLLRILHCDCLAFRMAQHNAAIGGRVESAVLQDGGLHAGDKLGNCRSRTHSSLTASRHLMLA
jgi:hypothetical protein